MRQVGRAGARRSLSVVRELCPRRLSTVLPLNGRTCAAPPLSGGPPHPPPDPEPRFTLETCPALFAHPAPTPLKPALLSVLKLELSYITEM